MIRVFLTVFVCLPVATALADFQVVENFTGLDPGNVNGQAQWFATAGTAEVTTDPIDLLNQVLAVSTNSGLVRNPMTVPDGQVHMMFFRLRFAQQQKYSIGLSPMSSPSEFSDFGTELGMANESNDLQVWDEEANPTYVELATLNQDAWYNVWVQVDADNDQYRVWVNDVPGIHANLADQLADDDNDLFGFRVSNASDLIRFYIKTGGGGTPGAPDGPVYIDDIYLDNVDRLLNLHNPLGLLGDLNSDGFVGIADLGIVLGNWNQAVPLGSLLAGDPSADGFVGIADLNEVLGNWNTGTPPTSYVTPEPATLGLLGLACLALLRRAH